MTRSSWLTFHAVIVALSLSSLGCELVAAVDRNLIGGTGGAGGTSTTSTTGGGGSGGAGGGPCVPVDDSNPCTDDSCSGGQPVHTPTAAGTSCSMGGALCDGKGACIECLSPADCPGQDDACQTRACNQGTCAMNFVPAGTVLAVQMTGDCKKDVCDGNGKTVSENDDGDLPIDPSPCTEDLCSAGVPSHTPTPKGTSCGQGLSCDGAGACLGCQDATDCPGNDDECNTRTCVNKACGVVFTPAGTAVANQTAGNCLVAACDGNGNITDQVDNNDLPSDDGKPCTDEVCTAGVASHPDKLSGTACNDGDACTTVDICVTGVCAGGTPVVCMASDACHAAGICNPATGMCSNPNKADGAACDDGNACTQSDSCQAGVCTGASPVVCALPDQCHDAGVCNPVTGVCSNPSKANGAVCSDGDSCTQSDTCQAGVCTGANPVVCPAPDQCHDAGVCNPATGVCSNPNKANGAACSDGNGCTQNDTCQAGVCTSGAPLVCPASDQCHDAGACDPATGVCSNPSKADGVACSNVNGCTQNDTCQAGTCTGGTPLTCAFGTSCSAGSCVADPIAYVKASNTGASDAFGGSVALSADGNTLAIGAYSEASSATGIDGNQNDNSAFSAGAVYVFTRSGGGWSQQAYVKASNTGAFDYFGRSVALSADGNTLAVGAYAEDSNATGINGDQSNNSANGAGAVYVFTRSGGVWSQQAYVKASNTGVSDEFGLSVALSADGNTLAVGAESEASNATGINDNQNDNSSNGAGAVYVFTRSVAAWSQQAYVKASNTAAGDFFGAGIALSADGNTLAVGAVTEDSNATGIDGNQNDNSAGAAGAAYVFTRSGGVWSQQSYVKASNTGGNDFFGGSVALSADGNTLAVGAHQEASNATGINGNQNDNSTAQSGAVYMFTRSGAVWSQQAYVKASNTGSSDQFGANVALSADGTRLAVGAYGESSNATGINGNQNDDSAFSAGAVYVLARSGGVWSQQAYVKASNTDAGDRFGTNVALSADGITLAVGAFKESSNATGINGNQNDNSINSAGAAYVY